MMPTDPESQKDVQSRHEKPFISRVPAPLHIVRPLAFTPQTLAIGPFHRTLIQESNYAFSFAEMEELKLIAAKALSAQASGKGVSFIVALAEEIAREEKKVRACFGRDMGLEKLDSKEMCSMLARDCIFIVAFINSLHNELLPANSKDERTWGLPSSFSHVYEGRFTNLMKKTVTLDLLLVENQVPLFLVKKAMQMMMDGRCGDVERLFQELLDAVAHRALPFCKKLKVMGGHQDAKHLLDCLYALVTRKNSVKEASAESFHVISTAPLLPGNSLQQETEGFIPTATKLRQAGVQFKGHSFNLSHVSFEGHTLTLPIIHVGDETERIFRNLLAHESQLVGRTEMASYLHFMNSLINTADDVAVLVEAGVISENVGDYNHVAKLWNQLTTNTMCIYTPQYNDVVRLAKDYVHTEIHGVLAEMRERYFSRPWLVLSLLSGTALLVMNFVIMWYTIQLYIKE